jgi:hypothetical protein
MRSSLIVVNSAVVTLKCEFLNLINFLETYRSSCDECVAAMKLISTCGVELANCWMEFNLLGLVLNAGRRGAIV